MGFWKHQGALKNDTESKERVSTIPRGNNSQKIVHKFRAKYNWFQTHSPFYNHFPWINIAFNFRIYNSLQRDQAFWVNLQN